MAQVYDYTSLAAGTNIVEYLMILNGATKGLIFTSVIILAVIIVLSVSYARYQDVTKAMVAGSVCGWVCALPAVLMKYNGETAVPLGVLIFFSITTAIALFMLYISKNN